MRLIAVLLAAALAAACARPAFRATDVSGAQWGRELALNDHAGKPRTLADFRGKVVVVFFGYIRCPDVCPTTLAELKSLVEGLGEDARRVQVLFVTVDPERDTPAVLSEYVTAFNPSFIGLYGDSDQLARTAKEYKVFFQKVPGTKPDNYSIDHTAGSYIYDPQGRIRLFARHGQVGMLSEDIRTLLKGA